MLTIENELSLLEKYNLTPTELFTVKVILLAAEEGQKEPILRYVNLLDGKFRLELEKLQSKGIILKSYNIPKSGTPLDVNDIELNKNFVKQFFRASFEMGEELFDTYPQFLTVNGVVYNARRVSKKFDSMEEAFAKYGKAIKYRQELHEQILDDIRWGINNGYNFSTLDSFIADYGWTAIHAFRTGEGINVNTESVKLI